MVLDVDFNLVFGLGMGDGETVAHFAFHTIFRADSEEGSDYTWGLGNAGIATDGMVEDREHGLISYWLVLAEESFEVEKISYLRLNYDI